MKRYFMASGTLLVMALFLPFFTYAQRIIIPEPPQPVPGRVGLFQLDLRQMQVTADIREQIAEVTLDQTFFNPTTNQLQGYYMYPVPTGASIRNFTMYINGVETKGELLDAQKARQIYDEILRRFQDPALLEYQDQALLRMRVFPIQPGAEQRITLTYTTVLPKDNGTTAFRLPMPVGADELGPQSFSAKIAIATSDPLRNVYCTSHEAEIIRKQTREATVGLEIDQSVPPADLQIYFAGDRKSVNASLLTYTEEKAKGHFFLNISPGLAEKEMIAEKDITFVLDASGSMAGPKLEQAKRALLFCLENMNTGDRFNIIRFSTEAQALFDGLQPYDNTRRREARAFVEELDAIGGTNMEEALQLAFDADEGERLHMVIFLTDGKPTIGETNEENLLKWVGSENTHQRRIFTFGIGTQLNTHLLDQLTNLTRAYRTYVLPEEDIEVKVSDFFTKVSAPVLTNVEWSLAGNGISCTDVYPRQLPDLFRGSSVSLLGRYTGSGTVTLLITGDSNGEKKAYEYELTFPETANEHDFIPPLWGARAVGFLLDQIRLNGDSPELVQEVVRLSKMYGIITPYTSYLILEDEVQQIGMNRMRQEDALLSPRMSQGAPAAPEQRKMYEESREEDGTGSVRASEDIQELNYSENIAQSQAGREYLDYEDAAGEARNLSDDIINVQGRAVYQNAGVWTDAKVQEKPNLPLNRIQFNSDAYFQLLEDEPDSHDFLALGRNVRFVLNGNLYEVFE